VAVTARGYRVRAGERVWDLEDGPQRGEPEVTGPGSALITDATGARRRVLWSRIAGADGGGFEVVVDGWRFELVVEPLDRARLRERARRGAAEVAAHTPVAVRAPIPGRITVVHVVEGERVEVGAALVSLEAMKMENVVRAPRAGTIGRVTVAADRTVELGDTLLELA
jgi:biotin carboxyl carrier protein